MRPIEAAAADPARKVVGNAQNAGKKLYNPAAAMQNIAIASGRLLWVIALNSKPAPATNIGMALCHFRSVVRSDDQPTSSSAAKATKYGSAETAVTVRFGSPDIALTIVGSQMLKPYRPVTMKKYASESKTTSRFRNASRILNACPDEVRSFSFCNSPAIHSRSSSASHFAWWGQSVR